MQQADLGRAGPVTIAASAAPGALENMRRRLDRSRLYDWALRVPIVAYSLFVLIRDLFSFADQILVDPARFERFDTALAVAVLARVSFWMFVASVAILPVFRLRPIAKSEYLAPRFAALVSVCLPPLFALLGRAPADLVLNSVSVGLGILANVFSVVALSFLGRSFSIMPEARRLVHSGPYSLVRHPLYLCQIVGLVAIGLQYRSLPATALLLSIVTLLVARALWEEEVLIRAFPDFTAYRSQTPFLIPRQPVRFLTMTFADTSAKLRGALAVFIVLALTVSVLAILSRLGGPPL